MQKNHRFHQLQYYSSIFLGFQDGAIENLDVSVRFNGHSLIQKVDNFDNFPRTV